MELTAQQILYIAIGALIVIVLAIVFARKVKATLNKDGFRISSEKAYKKDRVKVKKVDSSAVHVKNKDNQIVEVKDISDNSDIKIG